MADTRVDHDEIRKETMYKALRENDNVRVIELCQEVEDGALYDCSIQGSTVLQLACYFKKWDLATTLFRSLSEDLLNKLCERKNYWGDTVLHDACTSNDPKAVALVKKMLQFRPELLEQRNFVGETCVFRAIRYGKMKMFKLLARKVDEYDRLNCHFEHFFQRDDGSTILHTAILRRNFDLAVEIAERYPKMHNYKNQDNRTALQLLACSPAAFDSGHRSGCFKKLLYKCVSVADEEVDIEKEEVSCCVVPIMKEVRKMKKSDNDALRLSKLLIDKDTSWKDNTYTPSYDGTVHTIRGSSSSGDTRKSSSLQQSHVIKTGREDNNDHDEEAPLASPLVAARKECIETLNEALKKYTQEDYEREILNIDEAPLLMAARKGSIHIVELTLKLHPQALYHVNSYQENLLHVAIKSRNKDIFDYVMKEYGLYARGLLRALDKDKNSILHMVGCPRKENLDTKMKSPVVQLSEDYNLLKRLEEKCPSYLQYHRNSELKTAGEVFAERNEKLRTEAKEWITKISEHSIVVIILIATVAFTAAYTVPGGPDDKTGYPKLLTKPLFLVFAVTDVLSLGLALTAVVVFLMIITSSYQFNDFRRSLPRKLFWGFTLLFLSMTIMMVAFAATIILTVNETRRWTKIALYVVSFFPVCLFMIYNIPMYIKLAKGGIKDMVIEFRKLLPRPKRKCYSLPRTTRPSIS